MKTCHENSMKMLVVTPSPPFSEPQELLACGATDDTLKCADTLPKSHHNLITPWNNSEKVILLL